MLVQALKFENEIAEYRRSIFVLDNIYGTCITLGAILLFIVLGLTNFLYYIVAIAYLLISLFVFLLLKRNQYQIAVYINITISFIVLAIAILFIGNQYNIHFLFLSLGLSSFIYANNHTLNKIFLIIHCILFCTFALLPSQFLPRTVPNFAIIIVVLFFMSFIYKSMLIFNLYAKTYIMSINNGLIYKSIFENAFDGILNIRQNKLTGEKTSTHNIQLEKILGTKQINNTQQLFEHLTETQPDGNNSREKLQNIIDNLQINNQQKFEFTFKNTPDAHITTELTILKISELLDDFLIFILKDISEQTRQKKTIKKQVKKLQDKNEELKKYIDSNMQLENFAYITSHDLREPLRTISGFARLLERKYIGKLDKTADEYLGYILTSAQNMDALIQDLLLFSRVHNSSEHRVEEIDTEKLLQKIIESIQDTIKETGAIVVYENIPDTIIANESKIQQLFQNLIANAIKFRKKDTIPKVKIAAKSKQKYWEFTIQDNGIGIKDEYFDKIFMIFKRLHTKDEYEGTGIGLSLCKKIIEQHGGEIRLESKIGDGTTFYFTIEK